MEFRYLLCQIKIQCSRPVFKRAVSFSTALDPQSDGQSERTIQTLEDMLRVYVMNFHGNWDSKLPLIEDAYNNSYQGDKTTNPSILNNINLRRRITSHKSKKKIKRETKQSKAQRPSGRGPGRRRRHACGFVLKLAVVY
ncbi:hypothetical protein ABFS83_07G094200 [Erythranthe nasuta]